MKTLSKWSNSSLRTRFLVVSMIILIWLAIANCVQIFLFVGYVKQYNSMMETITLTNSINGVLKERLDNEIRDIIYGKFSFNEGSQYDLLGDMNRNLEEIEKKDEENEFTNEIHEVREILDTAEEYIDKLGQQIEYNVPAEDKNITYEYITIITDIINDRVQQLLQTTLNASEEDKNEIVNNLIRDITFYAILFILVILFSLWFLWYISGSIVKPIRKLRENANEIAEGNLTVDAVVVNSKNEIGDLCLSYNRMSDNLKEIILNVKNTNDLVMRSSKDIHQSIQENRFAGEEVAEATQTISVNLHKQDELIRKSVLTFETLFNQYNDILKRSNKIENSSRNTLSLADEGSKQLEELTPLHKKLKYTIEASNSDTEQIEKTTTKINENLMLLKLIAREISMLSVSAINELALQTNDSKDELDSIVRQLNHLANESYNTIRLTENNMELMQSNVTSIRNQSSDLMEQIRNGDLVVNRMRESFDSIYMINHRSYPEIKSISEDMDKAFFQMGEVHSMIAAIEERSKENKSEVSSIAAMGEEQLATLEEVSEASYKLVERIKVMKESIRQFKL